MKFLCCELMLFYCNIREVSLRNSWLQMMILGKDSSSPVVEARQYGSLTGNGSLSLYDEEVKTPRRERSISYLELSSSYNEASLLSNTSLQRMRCLSQSINDLKTLREKQLERKHEMGNLLNDDFLQDHAKKLKDARERIKILEAKYQSPKRKLDVSSLHRDKRQSRLDERNESSFVTEKPEKEETDGYKRSTHEQNGINCATLNTRKARKPRPLTWANEDDFSFESNSLSSFGSNRQRIMEIIPENRDWNRNRCYKIEGNAIHHFSPTEHSRSITNINATKWRSLPNLNESENSFVESRTFLPGEAIPLDPTAQKPHTKFTRKTGFYKVSESPRKSSTHPRSKTQKLRDFFRRKNPSKSKKNSQKLASSCKEATALGKVAA